MGEFFNQNQEENSQEKSKNRPRSALRDLMQLADVEKSKNIGERGPLVASRVTKEGEKNPELRLFEVVFGRDSLRTALELVDYYPELAKTTILKLAELQGTQNNPTTEEEPGRIHHEYRPKGDRRIKELAEKWELGDIDKMLYYGTIDATPLYIDLVGKYIETTDDFNILNEKIHNKDQKEITIKDSFFAAIDWICRKTDENGWGFIEYQAKNRKAIKNQVWKDSGDSYYHENGEIANGALPNQVSPIASIEVQANAYDALLYAIKIENKLDKNNQNYIDELQKRAQKLKDNTLDKFWMPDKNYFAIGLDRDKTNNLRQIKTVSSNAGHLLNSDIMEGNDTEIIKKREAIVTELFSKEMLAISGIRTVSKNAARFAPGSYHNGSVWISDNSFIADGLEKYGYSKLAHEIRLRNLLACNKVGKYVEFFRGDDSLIPSVNTQVIKKWDEQLNKNITLEQPPQEIQAWTVTAIFKEKKNRAKNFKIAKNIENKIGQFEEKILKDIRTRPGGLLSDKELKIFKGDK